MDPAEYSRQWNETQKQVGQMEALKTSAANQRYRQKNEAALAQINAEDVYKRQVQYKAIMEKLDCLTRTVNELRDKAGKRWDMIVDKAIWAAVAAVIAFLLGRMGLGG